MGRREATLGPGPLATPQLRPVICHHPPPCTGGFKERVLHRSCSAASGKPPAHEARARAHPARPPDDWQPAAAAAAPAAAQSRRSLRQTAARHPALMHGRVVLSMDLLLCASGPTAYCVLQGSCLMPNRDTWEHLDKDLHGGILEQIAQRNLHVQHVWAHHGDLRAASSPHPRRLSSSRATKLLMTKQRWLQHWPPTPVRAQHQKRVEQARGVHAFMSQFKRLSC